MSALRVLVTGATGFVGRWSLGPLLARGAEVHVMQRQVREVPTGVVVHAVDLHDSNAVDAVVNRVRPTHVLHFAWIATPGVYLTANENTRWVGSTLRLVEAFLRNGGRRVVTAGTVAEYDWSGGVCREETTPCRPSTLYAACKHAVYEVLERWSSQSGFGFAEGRLFWVYGPGEAAERLVPSLLRASVAGTPFHLRYPKQVRDYMHVADAGSAFAALLASDVSGAVNVGSGHGVALEEMARIVGEATQQGLTLGGAEEQASDQAPLVVADTTRLTEEVGWVPRYGLADGIAQTVGSWKAHDGATRT